MLNTFEVVDKMFDGLLHMIIMQRTCSILKLIFLVMNMFPGFESGIDTVLNVGASSKLLSEAPYGCNTLRKQCSWSKIMDYDAQMIIEQEIPFIRRCIDVHSDTCTHPRPKRGYSFVRHSIWTIAEEVETKNNESARVT